MLNKEAWLTRLETEKELVVEDWMISSFRIGQPWLSQLVKEQIEPPLQLQDWMVCCKEWQAVRL